MDALEALADPTRRRMIELLSVQDLTAGNIAARFEQSRPAVSRHLRLLREARVVDVRTEGTRRIYTLRRDPLADAEQWLRERLDALDTELRRARRG
jgi:DNA-binding transcriptional ArsR family regulator